MLTRFCAAVAAASLMVPATWGQAADEKFPAKPLTLVVPFTAGGSTDIYARAFAPQVRAKFGQPLVIENRPGGGSSIGAALVARATPDGHMLLFGSTSLAVQMAKQPPPPFDIQRDFAPITIVVNTPLFLSISPSFPARSFAQFIAYVKANPGKVDYGHPGSGGSPHLEAESFKFRAGIDMVPVPYKGSGPLLNAVLSGEVMVSFQGASSRPYIDAGKLIPLAVTSAKRQSWAPNVPTMDEVLPGYGESATWQGLLAPGRTPKGVIAALHASIADIIRSAEYRQRVAALDPELVANTPEEFAVIIRADVDKWGKLIRAAKIAVE